MASVSNSDKPLPISGSGLFDNHPENDKFECYVKGGVEFPILNWAKADGQPYDHWRAGGFGAILPYRLYHIQWSTLKRQVWMEPDYSPGKQYTNFTFILIYNKGEPVFVQKPGAQDEAEGVLLSLVSSFSKDIPAFIVVLDAKNMKEITRSYLPGEWTG